MLAYQSVNFSFITKPKKQPMNFFVGDSRFRLLRAGQKPEAEVCLKVPTAANIINLYLQIFAGEAVAPTVRSYDFVPENYEACRDELQDFFRPVSAAGGIVRDPAGRLLFIKRLGVWDLPKGKVEKKRKNALGCFARSFGRMRDCCQN